VKALKANHATKKLANVISVILNSVGILELAKFANFRNFRALETLILYLHIILDDGVKGNSFLRR